MPASKHPEPSKINLRPALKLVYDVQQSIREGQWRELTHFEPGTVLKDELVVAIYLALATMRASIKYTLQQEKNIAVCETLRTDLASFPAKLPGVEDYLYEHSVKACEDFLRAIISQFQIYAQPSLPRMQLTYFGSELAELGIRCLTRPEWAEEQRKIHSAQDQAGAMASAVLDRGVNVSCQPFLVANAEKTSLMGALMRGVDALELAILRTREKHDRGPQYTATVQVEDEIREGRTRTLGVRRYLEQRTRADLMEASCRIMNIVVHSTSVVEERRYIERDPPPVATR